MTTFLILNPRSENNILANNRGKLREFIQQLDDANGPDTVTAQNVWDALPQKYKDLVSPEDIASEAAAMGYHVQVIEP